MKKSALSLKSENLRFYIRPIWLFLRRLSSGTEHLKQRVQNT